jgi:sulfide dehydrogenase [flavocytochrome c] flavoprotein chain
MTDAMRRRTFLSLCAAASSGALSSRLAGARTSAAAHAKIVIIGGGFAGATCALYLRHLQPGLDVTLVDPDARYVTCPMSNSVLAGLRDLESITVGRDGLVRAGIRYARARVVSLDTSRRRARLDTGADLPYDRLVMAAGIRFLWGQPQGYDEAAAARMPHAWQAGAQTELLAAQLRGIRDGGVVAISVPAGPMRCPPGPFERASLIAGYLRQYKPRSKVVIFDANNHFPKQDVFTEAWRSLYPGLIEWIPVVDDGAVVRVAAEKMTLYTAQRTQRVDVANIIPPQAPALLAAQAGLASDHGWCPVNAQTFESQLIPNVYVIGDACIAEPMPKSASAAHAQAKHCAAAMVAALAGREPPEALFDSVCFSLLAAGNGLSIRGRFRVVEGRIESTAAPNQTAATAAEEAGNAERWYADIRAAAFGA